LVPVLLSALILVIATACGSAAQAPAGGNAAAPPEPAASAAPAGGDTGGRGAVDGNGEPYALVDDAKIVRTGSLQMTVADTDKAIVAGRNAIRALGGYIGASEQQRTDDKIVATVTYRIPVARWEDALDAIRRLGTEIGEQIKATEVTGQLVDLGARIRNLKASETALLGYAEKAAKISDLLEVQAQLTETRGEIERLSAEQAALSDQVAMATLTVSFGTDVVAVTEAAAKWDPAAEVDQAMATLIAVGQGVVSVLIVFAIVWLPILVGLAVLTLVGLVIARRLGWRRPRGFPPIGPIAPAPKA
jgi:hypothetical protein